MSQKGQSWVKGFALHAQLQRSFASLRMPVTRSGGLRRGESLPLTRTDKWSRPGRC